MINGITYPSQSYEPYIQSIIRNPGQSTEKTAGKESSPAECETCANRKYQDGSEIVVNDGNTFIQIQPKKQKLTIE